MAKVEIPDESLDRLAQFVPRSKLGRPRTIVRPRADDPDNYDSALFVRDILESYLKSPALRLLTHERKGTRELRERIRQLERGR